MITVRHFLESMAPHTYPSEAAYKAAVRVYIVRASGRIPKVSSTEQLRTP